MSAPILPSEPLREPPTCVHCGLAFRAHLGWYFRDGVRACPTLNGYVFTPAGVSTGSDQP